MFSKCNVGQKVQGFHILKAKQVVFLLIFAH